jgi:hypothetical protein
MSQVNATSYRDASGGSNAVLYGVAELKLIVEAL